MGIAFCFFTLPLTTIFAVPFGWLWQQVGTIRLSLCALTGRVCGALIRYGLLMLTFTPTLRWASALRSAVGGAAADLVLGWIM